MIIFLYGEDTFRSRQKLKELNNKFLKEVDPNRTSWHMIDGETARIEKISELVGPASLFSRKQMIIIEDIFSNKDHAIFNKIYDYLKVRGTGDNIVVFWDRVIETDKLTKTKKELFNFLKKQKYTQNFNQLSNTEVIEWTIKEVKKRNGKISRQAASILTSLVGSDLWQLDNEIKKLLSYKEGRESKIVAGGKIKTIESEDVMMLVRGNFDENIFALTDAIGKKDKSLAMKLFEQQMEAGLTDTYLLIMIIRQFKILLQIRVALDQGSSSRKIINQLKLHPFVVQKGINQVRNFTKPILKNVLNQLIKIDKAIKTGQADVRVMLNLLIVRL